MKKYLLIAFLSLMGLVPTVSAQRVNLTSQVNARSYSVAGLPVHLAGQLAIVIDANGFTCSTGGGTNSVLCFDTGATWLPLGGATVTGISADELLVGSGPGTSIFLPAVQGAMAYNDSTPGPQNFHQASVTELSDGTSGTGSVCLVTGCNLVNPNLNNFAATTGTFSGTGPSQTSYQYQATCTTPASGIEYVCAPINGFLQVSQNGLPYEAPPFHLLSTTYTNATVTPTTISGLQSPTIAKGETVIFHCTGLYVFATTAEEMALQVTTSQTPQSIWYDTMFNTSGSINFQSSLGAGNLLTAAAVGSTSAHLLWKIDGEMVWNASTAGTFSIQAATSSASGTLSVTPGASCEVDLVN